MRPKGKREANALNRGMVEMAFSAKHRQPPKRWLSKGRRVDAKKAIRQEATEHA